MNFQQQSEFMGKSYSHVYFFCDSSVDLRYITEYDSLIFHFSTRITNFYGYQKNVSKTKVSIHQYLPHLQLIPYMWKLYQSAKIMVDLFVVIKMFVQLVYFFLDFLIHGIRLLLKSTKPSSCPETFLTIGENSFLL